MITIAKRLRPFSHLLGTRCLIPGTPYMVEVFPALVRFYSLEESAPALIKETPIEEIEGPVSQFTVFQDLEKGSVSVYADRFSYHILPSLEMVTKKHPPLSISIKERLSLGSHKMQPWERVKDFSTIFPVWLRLGSLIKMPSLTEKRGIFSLISSCERAIDERQLEHILPAFQTLYAAGMSGLMVPRLEDDDHQGIRFPSKEKPSCTPLYLLTEGARMIRSLFFREEGNELNILPALPPEFHAGRLIHIQTTKGTVSIEWSKKTIRKVLFESNHEGKAFFRFPSKVISYRINKKQRITNGEEMEIKSGAIYLLDQFQK